MAEKGPKAKALAGGTDILVQLRAGRYKIDRLVDVKKIPEMNELSYTKKDGLTLGAAVQCYRVYEDEDVAKVFPGLLDSAFLIGGIQIQGRATIGGNLCNAAPSADAIPSLIALGATANIVGPEGSRSVAAEEFCTGPGQNVLKDGELLVSISIPTPEPNAASHYLRFIPRNEMDIAVVGVAAAVLVSNGKIDSARIALASVAPTPVFAKAAGDLLKGKAADEASIELASEEAKKAAKPITDMRGTIEQRVHLVGVLTKRVLREAVERAKRE
jgi:carbon-monoxide dehydrogenase medium subunit